MNRKFILIGLLLGACFAFTVLQAATGEAQECDPNPACIENCCGQCDPNPACVENCCPAGDPNAPANVTLDPNIDPRSPAPSGNVTLDPNIDPRSPNPKGSKQHPLRPQKSGKPRNQGSAVQLPKGGRVNVDSVNRSIKPNMQGSVQSQSEASNGASSIGKEMGNSNMQRHRNDEVRALQGQWIGCAMIRAEIVPRLGDALDSANNIEDSILEYGTLCGSDPLKRGDRARMRRCLLQHMDDDPEMGMFGLIYSRIREKIGEIQNIINDRC